MRALHERERIERLLARPSLGQAELHKHADGGFLAEVVEARATSQCI